MSSSEGHRGTKLVGLSNGSWNLAVEVAHQRLTEGRQLAVISLQLAVILELAGEVNEVINV